MTSALIIRETKNGLSFDIRVNPHASREDIGDITEGVLTVKVTAPPVEGASNEACIGLIAKKLGLRKSQITITTGARGRKKTILVRQIGRSDLEQKILRITTQCP